MKIGKILGISAVVVILAIVVYFAFIRKSKAGETSEAKKDVLPDNPLPEIEPAKEATPINTDSPIVRERMKQIFRNRQERENVIQEYSVPVALVASTQNPSGVQEVLTISGLAEIPIIPPFISQEYQKQINDLQKLRTFEELTFQSGFDDAKSIYDKALFFKNLQTGLFPFIQKVADGDGFGKKKKGDNDRSNNISAGIEDFRKLFKQTLEANKQLENALKDEAIKQLRAAGYKFVGYDS